MSLSPDDLLGDAPLRAAVSALAERNRHHLDDMSPSEQGEALAHWRELATAVLAAARGTLGDEGPSADDGEGPGRAVIVLEDGEPGEVTVHASFFPQLEDLGGGEVAATPAQAAALELLDGLADEPPADDD